MAEVLPSSSANEPNEAAIKEEDDSPSGSKKIKLTTDHPTPVEGCKTENLEYRLGGILCCAVCLDLPKTAIYQCTNGHLMCAGCFSHLLADARLRDETATCPNCRIEISKISATRNLAVEKAVSELPSECQFCGKDYPRNLISRHEQSLCNERITICRYSRIGCPWRGPFHEHAEHEKVCQFPCTTGAQILEVLDVIDKKNQEEKCLYDSIFDLLSYEHIVLNDLQLKPYRTDEFIHKLYYESLRFSAFNYQWVVKTRINDFQRDPALSCQREMSYQLSLKSKISVPMNIHYMVLKGPSSDIKLKARIYKFEFTELENEAPYVKLPLLNTAECNRLLAARTISFRLIMFLLPR
ncbi:zinc finger TRAF-type-containing protein 1 homolog isoform X2 [Planococcus citri]|uniref:zinc finger TRAF-type-containing protein 1 homolog isoform X2 n=1 Tax=Planococcus citri TaxID=170843 RepID=UPI0031F9759A